MESSDLDYFQSFVLLFVATFVVMIIFPGSRDQNNLLRCCLFSLIVPLLVTGFLIVFLKRHVNYFFCRFSLGVKLDTFCCYDEQKLKICFANVDSYVRLILGIIL